MYHPPMITILGVSYVSYRHAAQSIYVPPGLAAEISHLSVRTLGRYDRDGRCDGYCLRAGRCTSYRLDGLALLRLRRAMSRRHPIRRPSDWTIRDLDRAVDLLSPGLHARFQVERDLIRRVALCDKSNCLTVIRIAQTQS